MSIRNELNERVLHTMLEGLKQGEVATQNSHSYFLFANAHVSMQGEPATDFFIS